MIRKTLLFFASMLTAVALGFLIQEAGPHLAGNPALLAWVVLFGAVAFCIAVFLHDKAIDTRSLEYMVAQHLVAIASFLGLVYMTSRGFT